MRATDRGRQVWRATATVFAACSPLHPSATAVTTGAIAMPDHGRRCNGDGQQQTNRFIRPPQEALLCRTSAT